METLYQKKYYVKPSLEVQGSDTFLGKLYKDVAKGSVSLYPLHKVQPYLADVDPAPMTHTNARKERRVTRNRMKFRQLHGRLGSNA
eukprot:5908306-Amphidinium_carterae.1